MCYPEFYLEHAEGEGHWYPCESAGTRAFGEMPLARTILQKGDNFRVPERKEKLRYASDFMIGLPTPGGGKPKVKYIREIEPLSGVQTQSASGELVEGRGSSARNMRLALDPRLEALDYFVLASAATAACSMPSNEWPPQTQVPERSYSMYRGMASMPIIWNV